MPNPTRLGHSPSAPLALQALFSLGLLLGPTQAGEPAPYLPAKEKRDALGNRYLEVTGRIEKLSIERRGIRGVAASPDGSEIYVIRAKRSEVTVFDPVSLQQTGAFSVPRYPTAIWCDETHLLVAASESGVVVVFERVTRKPIHSFHFPEAKSSPYALGGRAVDGTFLSLWRRDAGHQAVGHTPEGPLWTFGPRGLGIRWALPAPKERIVVGATQGVQLWDRRAATPIGKPRKDLNFRTGRLFPTRDGKSLVSIRPGPPQGSPYLTYLMDWSLKDSSEPPIPGLVVAEVSDPPAFVVLEQVPLPHPKSHQKTSQVVFLGRNSGLPRRRVVFPSGAHVPQNLRLGTYCFVPKAERILAWQSEYGAVLVMVCGPVKAAPAPPSKPKRSPPLKVKTGEKLEFTPTFSAGTGKRVSFALEVAPSGATIDPKTGTFRWTPSEISLGRWDVEISAEVDGVRKLVARWVVEVQ